jgi:hypothetical protein
VGEGVAWTLRGIREDGSFYGELLVRSRDAAERWGACVDGQLSPAEVARLSELVAVIRRQPPPEEAGPSLGVLFERLSPTNAGQVRRLFEYRVGDEASSEEARAFLQLVELLRPYVVAAAEAQRGNMLSRPSSD